MSDTKQMTKERKKEKKEWEKGKICKEKKMEERERENDGPGPVMVSSTLCPAVHILGSQNVYGRAKGFADHYWPWLFSLMIY